MLSNVCCSGWTASNACLNFPSAMSTSINDTIKCLRDDVHFPCEATESISASILFRASRQLNLWRPLCSTNHYTVAPYTITWFKIRLASSTSSPRSQVYRRSPPLGNSFVSFVFPLFPLCPFNSQTPSFVTHPLFIPSLLGNSGQSVRYISSL